MAGERPEIDESKSLKTINVKLDAETLAALDSEVRDLTSEVPGATFNRTDAIRILIKRARTARRSKKA